MSIDIRGKHIVVTGGAGTIGRPTLSLLRKQGARVTNFDLVAAGVDGVFDVIGDICNRDALLDVFRGADAVVHLGGIPGPDIVSDQETYAVNTVGTYAVFSASAEAELKKVVYASSINANGIPIAKLRAPHIIPYDEDELAVFGDSYSLSKAANEQAAAMAEARWGLSLTGLRFPLVRDVTIAGGQVFAEQIRCALRQDPIRQAYEGFSYLDASDASRAILAALKHETPAAPGILVAAPKTYLRENTIQALAKIIPEVQVAEIPGRSVGLNLSRANKLLAFTSQIFLEDLGEDLLATVSVFGDE